MTLVADPRHPWRCGSCQFSCECLADHKDCLGAFFRQAHHARILTRSVPLDIDQLQQDGAQDTARPRSRLFPGE